MEKMTTCSWFLWIAGTGISYQSSRQTHVISFGVNSRSVTRIIIKALPSLKFATPEVSGARCAKPLCLQKVTNRRECWDNLWNMCDVYCT